MAKASLEIADLITFPLCKSSSTNQRRKKDKNRSGKWELAITQKSEQMGCTMSSLLKRP